MEGLVNYPQVLEIGSTGRNSGKTFFAKDIIMRYKDKYPIVALKIITIRGARGVCQRGGVGCGICTSIDEGYELIEETNARGKKDTMELLKSGCQKAYLLKAFEDSLLKGFEAFLKEIDAETLVICESNSLRKYILPGLFVMINNQRGMKKSAEEVLEQADFVIDKAQVLDSDLTVAVEQTGDFLTWTKRKSERQNVAQMIRI